MKNIVSFSGGKDSTAMLLRMIELDMPIDEIIYFDCESWEFPQMTDHIKKVEKYTGKTIIKLKAKRDFNYWMFDHKAKRGKWKDKIGRGFPSAWMRWCTREKVVVLDKVMRESIVYIGYAVDEMARTNRPILKRKKYEIKFPLIEWGWSEKDCLDYCYSKGFDWSGLYKYFKRVSCWCCPLQGLRELRNLRKYFPELWKRLLDMQEKAWNSFRMDGKTVHDLDARFEAEDSQLKLFEEDK